MKISITGVTGLVGSHLVKLLSSPNSDGSTNDIKALIRENNIHQIDNYILSGAKDGMIRMDDSILALYNDNFITKENALYYSHKPSELAKKLNDF